MKDRTRDSFEFRDKTTLGVDIMALLVIIPFAVNNFIQGRTLLGLTSMAIVAVLSGSVWLILRGRSFSWLTLFGLVPAALLFLGLSIHRQGVIGVLWCYTATLSFYFMLPEKKAWAASALLMITMVPMAWFSISHQVMLRMAATLLSVNAFCIVFIRIIASQQEKLKDLAATDPLTGLLNRRLLADLLAQAVAQHRRSGSPMSLLSLDIDHFKSINDSRGHSVGDIVLRRIGQSLLDRCRKSDVVFRLGGEEFLVLLHDTPEENGRTLAESLRQSIAGSPLLEDRKVTVSIGVAELLPEEEWTGWMHRADEQLYRAKQSGRNRVVVAGA